MAVEFEKDWAVVNGNRILIVKDTKEQAEKKADKMQGQVEVIAIPANLRGISI